MDNHDVWVELVEERLKRGIKMDDLRVVLDVLADIERDVRRKAGNEEKQEALDGFMDEDAEGIDWLGGEYTGKKQRLQKELVRLGGGSEW